MFVMLTQPSKNRPYQYANGGPCHQGFFCGFHPISKCSDVEVWSKAELKDTAVNNGGWFLGRYGRKQELSAQQMADLRGQGSGDDVIDIGDVWNMDVPHVRNCLWGLWVPKQFRSIGTEREWQSLARLCKYDAFDHYPEGRKKANGDVLRWRSMLTAYLFQPLPEVMQVVQRKLKRTKLVAGDRCVSVHVRRGDKYKAGPHREGYFHPLDEYLGRAWDLIEKHRGSGTVVMHSDDFVSVLEEWKTSKFRGRINLIFDPTEASSTGWDVALLYDLANFHNVIASVWMFSECPLTVGALESVFYKFGIHIGVARGIWEAENNIYNSTFEFGVLAVPLRGWYNFVP